MAGASERVHDRAILDALDLIDPVAWQGEVWRVIRKGREPLRGSSATGRWSPGPAVEVLYTSLKREGALAEVGFRLSIEPVWPSRIEHEIHQFGVKTEKTLHIANVDALLPLGVDIAQYQSFDYTATQAIAAAAHFLDFDGLLVPSARSADTNLVLFLDRSAIASVLQVQSTEVVDWEAWKKRRRSPT